ncbi:hypothetical protein [Actinoplanes sp. NPDC049265]|uniref:hypothetical protein n=1 Tax=Actinoplanes sp. NPDC049265 TaxID=3363902 RepID=UPI00370FE8AC
MNKLETGRWLVWGDYTPAEATRTVLTAMGEAFDDLPVVDLDEPSATEHQSIDDCGEGDPLAGLESEDELHALIHQRDPEWTPPGTADTNARRSWMGMVHDATEADIMAGWPGKRGYLPLPDRAP